MRKFALVMMVGALMASGANMARADEKDKAAVAVLDKAIAAIGGADKLAKVKSTSWSAKGTVNINGTDSTFTTESTAAGIDQLKSTFTGNFDGNEVVFHSVLDGKKGWVRFNDMTMEIPEDRVASMSRDIYLSQAALLILPLKGDKFKVESGGEETIDGVAHNVLRVVGPDGKDFKLLFDKENGLLAKSVATVQDFSGQDFTQESSYKDFKDFGGVRVATKVSRKRDGDRFLEEEVTVFKASETVDPKTFAEPE